MVVGWNSWGDPAVTDCQGRLMFSSFRRVPLKQFVKDLSKEIDEDNLSSGAAAIAFYLVLAIIPTVTALLTFIRYLNISFPREASLTFFRHLLGAAAAQPIGGFVDRITSQPRGEFLYLAALFTIWVAARGMSVIMDQLNITCGVKESRSFWKAQGIALFLTLIYVVLMIGAFFLIMLGSVVEAWLASLTGRSEALLVFFIICRWVVSLGLFLLALASIYYFAPAGKQKFRFASWGTILGMLILVGISILFRLYVINFSTYSAIYGGVGTVIVVMIWLYITGWVILLGSEVDALIERYSLSGNKTEKKTRP